MKSHFKHIFAAAAMLVTGYGASAQTNFTFNNDSLYQTGTPNTGRVWGYTFGDFYYKGHADSATRGGANQYTGIPGGRNAFQLRRIYLGYDYNISKKFSAELLLSAEDNFPGENPPGSTNAASGDLLSNGKEAFFIKLANVKWKNVWNGTDLVVGMQGTPGFANLTEKVWNYRSIERTIADIRRTPSYDMGVGLNGTFDPKTKNFGYDLLVANGTSDRPAASSFKWFYGDVWAKFLDKKLIVDLYGDYQRLNWTPTWHHDRQMLKAFVAYNTQPITVGVEGFVNNIKQDTKAALVSNPASFDTLSTKAQGISFYVHGDIVPSKLRFFARYDMYNPNKNIDNSKYASYAGISSPGGYNSPSYHLSYDGSTTGAPTGATSTGDVTGKETFITAGLDFTPIKNVHLEPNIWYNSYSSQLKGVSNKDHDLVYRLTFFYVFGKTYKNTYNQF